MALDANGVVYASGTKPIAMQGGSDVQPGLKPMHFFYYNIELAIYRDFKWIFNVIIS